MAETLTGGCQCGAVRYRAIWYAAASAYWCRCRMCQRAVGNVAAALVNVNKADVEWTRAMPTYFASSAIGTRGFCAACGTPLTFAYADSERMDLTVGSLDEPERMALSSHFGVESWVPGWIPHDDLPTQAAESYAPLLARRTRAEAASVDHETAGDTAE